jgi:hypothetical protein
VPTSQASLCDRFAGQHIKSARQNLSLALIATISYTEPSTAAVGQKRSSANARDRPQPDKILCTRFTLDGK